MSTVFVIATRWPAWARLACLAVIVTAVGMSFSRIGLITLAISLVLAVLLLGRWMTRAMRVGVVVLLVVASAVAVPLLGDVFTAAGEEAGGSAEYRSDLVDALRGHARARHHDELDRAPVGRDLLRILPIHRQRAGAHRPALRHRAARRPRSPPSSPASSACCGDEPLRPRSRSPRRSPHSRRSRSSRSTGTSSGSSGASRSPRIPSNEPTASLHRAQCAPSPSMRPEESECEGGERDDGQHERGTSRRGAPEAVVGRAARDDPGRRRRIRGFQHGHADLPLDRLPLLLAAHGLQRVRHQPGIGVHAGADAVVRQARDVRGRPRPGREGARRGPEHDPAPPPDERHDSAEHRDPRRPRRIDRSRSRGPHREHRGGLAHRRRRRGRTRDLGRRGHGDGPIDRPGESRDLPDVAEQAAGCAARRAARLPRRRRGARARRRPRHTGSLGGGVEGHHGAPGPGIDRADGLVVGSPAGGDPAAERERGRGVPACPIRASIRVGQP